VVTGAGAAGGGAAPRHPAMIARSTATLEGDLMQRTLAWRALFIFSTSLSWVSVRVCSMKHRLTSLVAFFNCDAAPRPRLAVNEPVAFRNTHADIAVDDDAMTAAETC
jgi:hypothetical protein